MASRSVLPLVVGAVVLSSASSFAQPKKPAAGPTVLASNAGKATGMITDETAVYWSTGNKLLAVDKTGGAMRTVQAASVSALGTAAGKLTWGAGSAVYMLPGSAPTKDFASSEVVTVEGIFPSVAPSVCVTRHQGAAMLTRIGCFDPAQPAAGIDLDFPSPSVSLRVVLDQGKIYWADDLEKTGTEGIYAATYAPTTKAVGKPVRLASSDHATGLIADAGTLFWFEKAGLVSLSTATTPPTRTVLAAGATGSSLASDATHVYWLSSAGISRVPRAAGGKVENVAKKADAFTIDASSVYWLDAGKVNKLPKG